MTTGGATPAHILDRVPLSHDLDNARYERMRWNTPLSEEHAVLLLSRLDIRPGASLVDLGCDMFLEVGPKRALSGMMRELAPGAKAVAVGTPAAIAERSCCAS